LCGFGEFLAGDWMQFNRGLLLLAGVSIAHHDLEIRASLGKRLERGRFVWPQADSGKIHLTQAQLSMLLEGIDWKQPRRTGEPLSML